ncbi:hypothetical protein WJ59_31400 [Burkholderia gladioli]|uniref:hypothetical protein n=1 Tax=Burkholderia gladioli TaxID=28095 RepID=UPI00075DEDE3|nr:hypothetical protein [Burkholderia gladioli]KVM59768.1 hypothetical protein WJ59_31400 [Burkholderia gladioli]
MTNIDCLNDIMTYSRHGALAQAFVMDALSKHARRVATVPLDTLQEQFGARTPVNVEAWQGVAREIHDKLEAHFAQ